MRKDEEDLKEGKNGRPRRWEGSDERKESECVEGVSAGKRGANSGRLDVNSSQGIFVLT